MHIDAARVPLKIQVNLHPRHLPTHFPSTPQEPPKSENHHHAPLAFHSCKGEAQPRGANANVDDARGPGGRCQESGGGQKFSAHFTATSWYRRRKQRSKEAMLIATHSLLHTQEPFPGLPFKKAHTFSQCFSLPNWLDPLGDGSGLLATPKKCGIICFLSRFFP